MRWFVSAVSIVSVSLGVGFIYLLAAIVGFMPPDLPIPVVLLIEFATIGAGGILICFGVLIFHLYVLRIRPAKDERDKR